MKRHRHLHPQGSTKHYETASGQLIHPSAPAGGGGPGHFRAVGIVDFIAQFFSSIPHPYSPAGREHLPELILSYPQSHQPVKSAAVAAPGTGTKLTDTDFTNAATALGAGVSTSIIRAFASVESGGKSGFGAEGLPIIAYEGHWFAKLTKPKHQYDKTHPLLSYAYKQKAGTEWQLNNKNQQTAWQTLREAMELDHEAALQACSWGMFQVMGFNFKDCGYFSVDTFVAAMKAGENGQLNAFVGYCKKKKGMIEALKKHDYKTMATLYNGEDFGDYDKRIEKAHKRFGGD